MKVATTLAVLLGLLIASDWGGSWGVRCEGEARPERATLRIRVSYPEESEPVDTSAWIDFLPWAPLTR